MNFTEFLREEEIFDTLYDSVLDEGLWDVIAGGAQAFDGAMTVPDEALAKLVGQGTKGRMSRGFSNIGRGMKRAMFGRPMQTATATSPASASAEDIRAVAAEFKRLASAFKQARKRGEKDLARRIAGRMYRIDPVAYRELEVKSIEARKEMHRKKWSFLDGSGPPQRPEDYLARLSAEN